MESFLSRISCPTLLCSFFPAGLSLVIELMFTKAGRPQWDVKQIIKSLPPEEPVQNPVVYRVRVIAMTCLVVVHTLCRLALNFKPSFFRFAIRKRQLFIAEICL